MGLIPENVIREIRDRTDIVGLIGRHVQLRKVGQRHTGLCPFHNEKTPSFSVNGERGFFYCFGCQKKGDAFTFVMEYEGKSFLEAAESLAAMCGVELPKTEEPEAVRRQRSERAAMLEINKAAARFFRAMLEDESRGVPGRRYLEERGIARETASAFGLGYAPDEWRALGDHLAESGASMDLAVKVGLVARQPNAGGYYDRFRSRLVCPVIVPGGEVVGFSARLLDPEAKAAKYINSPESAVYKKSRLLYGLHRARDAFRAKRRAVVVEGNFDVISMHQAGFEETVAPLGTALTEEQIDQLRRLSDHVVLLYDGDKAGRAASLKALRALMAADVEARMAALPLGEDPDSFLGDHGSNDMGQLLDRAQPAIEYFAYEVWGAAARSADSRARALAEAAEVVRAVRNPTKRDLITGTLASAMGVDVNLVRRAVSRTREPQAPIREAPKAAPEPPATPRERAPRWELELICLLADHPHLLEPAEENNVFSLLTDARLRDMYCALRQGRPLVTAMPPELHSADASRVLSGTYATVKNPAHTLRDMVANLPRKDARAQLADLQRRAEVAKRRGDAELERKLVQEILSMRRQVD